MANYPASVFAPASKNTGDIVQAAHVNDLQGEVVAVENGLLNGFAHGITVTSGGVTISTGGLAVAGNSSFVGSVVINHSTLQGAGSHLQVRGVSPSIELIESSLVQNWYVGISSTDSDALYVGAGYGPAQGIAPAIKIAVAGGTNDVTFTGDVTILGTATFTGGFVAQAKCMLAATAATALPSNTWTSISFDTEVFDTGNMHSTAVNPTLVTIPAGSSGTYDIGAIVPLNASAVRNSVLLRFLKNSTTEMGAYMYVERSSSHVVTLHGSFPIVADAGETFEVQVRPIDSTGSVPISGMTRAQFWLTRYVA